jgi:hypothetical protein
LRSIVVALGALLGIVTGVLVGQMAVARILAAVGRAHLVFPIIGEVHPRFHTPAVRWGGMGQRKYWRWLWQQLRDGPRRAAPSQPSHPRPSSCCPLAPLPCPRPASALVLGVPTTLLALLSELPMLVRPRH